MTDIRMALDQSVFSAHWCGHCFLAGSISKTSSPHPFFESRLRRQNFNQTTFGTSCQSCFPSSNCNFVCGHPFIEKPMFITEPAVLSARILDLGSKLCPSNMLHMPNKDLTRFIQTLSRARQNRVHERKALLSH